MPPTCLGCGKPFKSNGTIASLPVGRRIAFDPKRGRVWRICRRCDEWNLLSSDTAAAVLPEIIAWFDGTEGPSTPGITTRRPDPAIELLRLGSRDELIGNAMTLASRTRELRRAGLWPAVFLLGMIGVLVATIIAGWRPDFWSVGQLLAWLGAMTLAMRWRNLHLGLRPRRSTWLWPWTALLGGVLICSTAGAGQSVATAMESLAAALFFGFCTEWFAFQASRVRLPSGDRLRASVPSLRALTIARFPDTESLVVVPHGGGPLDSDDSRFVLTHLTEWAAGLPDRIIDQGHALVSHTSGPGELLDLLPNSEYGGRAEWRLDDLPLAWWVALDMALTREARRHEASERAREIGQVASLAEHLESSSGIPPSNLLSTSDGTDA